MLKPTDIYRLEKALWTEADFRQMGWHDVNVHTMTIEPEKRDLIFDLDYMFAWVEPEAPSPYYTFWISPVTLVFRNLTNFKASLGEPHGGITIMGVERSEPRTSLLAKEAQEWTWTIDLLQGEIAFGSAGYIQYTRKSPIRCKSQRLSVEERGGISIDRPSEFNPEGRPPARP